MHLLIVVWLSYNVLRENSGHNQGSPTSARKLADDGEIMRRSMA